MDGSKVSVNLYAVTEMSVRLNSIPDAQGYPYESSGERSGHRVELSCGLHHLLLHHRAPALRSRSGGGFSNSTSPKVKLELSGIRERERERVECSKSPIIGQRVGFYTYDGGSVVRDPLMVVDFSKE